MHIANTFSARVRFNVLSIGYNNTISKHRIIVFFCNNNISALYFILKLSLNSFFV